MTALAFVIAAKTGSGWSDLIAAASASPYSHVELWLGGPKTAALCFSSREPAGASFEIIDLTQPKYEIVPLNVTPLEEAKILGFCLGANGKSYDGMGLIGYKFGTGLHDDHDVFCSEVCASDLQKCAGLFTGPEITLDMLLKSPYPDAFSTKRAWMISPGDLHALAVAK